MAFLRIKLDRKSLRSIIDRGVVSRRIRAYLREVKAEIVRLFRLPKSGRYYRKPNGRVYQASAPGEPPAIRTGGLMRSVKEAFPNWATGEIVIDEPADWLERGTRRMRKRPFVRPALRTVNAKFGDVRARL